MNPYARAARFLLRLIATGLILVGGLLVGIELGRRPLMGSENHFEISKTSLVLNSLMFLAGVILLFTSGRLAKKIGSHFDE